MKILYFASIRAQIGKSAEEVLKTSEILTAGDLIAELRARGGGYAAALGDAAAVKVAVNQEYVPWDRLLKNDDEVALFPPVTGG